MKAMKKAGAQLNNVTGPDKPCSKHGIVAQSYMCIWAVGVEVALGVSGMPKISL